MSTIKRRKLSHGTAQAPRPKIQGPSPKARQPKQIEQEESDDGEEEEEEDQSDSETSSVEDTATAIEAVGSDGEDADGASAEEAPLPTTFKELVSLRCWSLFGFYDEHHANMNMHPGNC